MNVEEIYTPGGMQGGPGLYDAGHGVSYTPYYLDPEHTRIGGLWMWHPCPNRRRNMFCEDGDDGIKGYGPITRTSLKWGYYNVETPERITLEGSVLCDCGWHGWVREGRWEPCG